MIEIRRALTVAGGVEGTDGFGDVSDFGFHRHAPLGIKFPDCSFNQRPFFLVQVKIVVQ